MVIKKYVPVSHTNVFVLDINDAFVTGLNMYLKYELENKDFSNLTLNDVKEILDINSAREDELVLNAFGERVSLGILVRDYIDTMLDCNFAYYIPGDSDFENYELEIE